MQLWDNIVQFNAGVIVENHLAFSVKADGKVCCLNVQVHSGFSNFHPQTSCWIVCVRVCL